jgi:predicted Rossmann-fold nucleotide-binding protein
MEHELRQYPRVALDLATLETAAERIVLVGGSDSQDQMPYQAGKALARRLGLEVVDLPGGHPGFMAAPAAFAETLMMALKDD